MITTVLTALVMLPAIGGGVPLSTPPSEPLQAISAVHVGESDKPLSSFVLTLEALDPSEVANILQQPLKHPVDIFVVPEKTLDDVSRIVRATIPRGASKAYAQHAFGSFSIILRTARSRRRMLMDPKQSKRVFQDIWRYLDSTQPALRTYIANLLLRLGAELPDDKFH